MSAELPTINITGRQLADIAAEVARHLIETEQFFTNGVEVAVLVHPDDEPPRLEPLSRDELTAQLLTRFNWVRRSKHGDEPAAVPDQVVKVLAHATDWPVVRRVVTAPVYGPDGALMSEPGLHNAAAVWHEPAHGLHPGDARQWRTALPLPDARRMIESELLGDFPFADAASRAHAIALVLAPFVRDLINGDTPLYWVDATGSRTGKGLLVDACTMPALGIRPARRKWANREEERDKRFLAVLRTGTPVVVIDNVKTTLGGDSIEMLLTSDRYAGRKLGESVDVSYPNRATWVATSNNATLTHDMAGRVALIRLDAQVEDPGQRTGPRPGTAWRHPDLRKWVQTNRADLVHAALGYVTQWIAADRPKYLGPAVLGGFEEWVAIMGGILQVAGVEGFLENRHEVEIASDENDEWLAFLEAWYRVLGDIDYPARDLTEKLPTAPWPDEVLNPRSSVHYREADPRRLGKALAKRRDAHIGPYVIRRIAYPGSKNAARWQVTVAEPDMQSAAVAA